MIDLHLTFAYVAAGLATAALVCDEAAGLRTVRAPGPVLAGTEHPGQPDRPEWVRRPMDDASRRDERPMAGHATGLGRLGLASER